MKQTVILLFLLLCACLVFMSCSQPISGTQETTYPQDTIQPQEGQNTPNETTELDFHLLSDGTYGVSIGKSLYFEEIVIPATYNGKAVTAIETNGFSNANNLKKITLPESITTIRYGAFFMCKALESITIPNGVRSIGGFAFSGCTGLTSITIPSSVTNIADFAFSDCTGLMSITVEKDNPKYHSAGNCLIATASKTLIIGCKNSIIPIDGSVTDIKSSAFYGCTELTSITIPNSITDIEFSAFEDCTGLTSITIGNGVTCIGVRMFYKCIGLTNITIPDSVTSIDSLAFYMCDNLTTVYYTGTPENWKNIIIDASNPDLFHATRYYYSEKQPTDITYQYWHYVDGVPTVWETDTAQ